METKKINTKKEAVLLEVVDSEKGVYEEKNRIPHSKIGLDIFYVKMPNLSNINNTLNPLNDFIWQKNQ